MPEHIKGKLSNLSRYASKAGVKEGKKEIVQISIEDVRDMRKKFLADLSGNYAALEGKIASIAANQEQILKVTDSLTKNAEGISTAAKGIEDKVAKVNDATAQFASTTRTYRDALAAQPNHPPTTMIDLKLKDDLARREKQILVVTPSDALGGKSLTEIKSKAEEAIAEMEDVRDRPEKVEVETVSITHSKAILLQLCSKEAAEWLRDPLIETKFTAKFAKDSLFIDRSYNIIVPRTPITFDPSNTEHLRELEECNNLDTNTIKKARWIKPVNRRREGQAHAYATLTLASPTTANDLIRNGIRICRVKTQPSKLKREPLQCLRCRGWGHIAAQCLNDCDTCGACGEQHSTNDCNNPNIRFCVSCMVDTHASWDRGCPEFIWRCEIYNGRYPENNLPFFPTNEEWTLTTRPDKIPLENRFPQRYAVNNIPSKSAPRRTQQQNQKRTKPKRQNARAAPTKGSAQNGDANTIDKYFPSSQTNAVASSSTREEGEPSGPSWRDEPANNEGNFIEQLIGDTLATTPPLRIPGWS
jgi:hypothetical protein